MISDGTDAMDFEIVEMGGYVRHSELSPTQRRSMYTEERGNLLASRVMGQQRYLRVIRQQNIGAVAGQDTDEQMDENRESESEVGEDLIPVDGSGPWTNMVEELRRELNEALSNKHFRDAKELQMVVLIVLDNLTAGNLRVAQQRNAILNEFAGRIESMMPRHRFFTPAVADRFTVLAQTMRLMVESPNETGSS